MFLLKVIVKTLQYELKKMDDWRDA